MFEPAPVRILKADDGFALLRLFAVVALDAARDELIQAQRRRNLAEQAAAQFDPHELDGKLD